MSTNVIPTEEQLNENILILTNSEYSFKGITIKDPTYRIVPVEEGQIFGNAGMMGSYTFSKNNDKMQGLPTGSDGTGMLYFIVATPQGATSSYVEKATEGLSPYIVNGKIYGLLNASQSPIYEFSK